MAIDKSNLSSLFTASLIEKDLSESAEAPKSWEELIAGECARDMTLAARFLVPPFDILNAKQPYWAEKQQKWIPVFDPLLCEIVYKWAMPTKERLNKS